MRKVYERVVKLMGRGALPPLELAMEERGHSDMLLNRVVELVRK